MRDTVDVLLFDRAFCDFNRDNVALLDVVGRQTLGSFWDFAHPVSGLDRERSNITPVLSALVPVGDFQSEG